jgi:predicted nucleic acid-binding protein
MTQYLADSNVALDLATHDSVWYDWSRKGLRRAALEGQVLVNPIIYAEVAPAFLTEPELEEWMAEMDFRCVSLPFAAAWPAARAFARYKKAGGTRTAPLPDFFIGAQVEGLTLITRDAARFRTYFPDVKLIVPS